MRINVYCPLCLQNQQLEPQLKTNSLEIENNSYYCFKCRMGHNVSCYVVNRTFEILFDFGIFAFKNGFYREATANVMSSLERYFEYCIKIFCKSLDLSFDDISTQWKEVDSQSERQLGAFLFLNLIFMKKPIKPLKDDIVKFRNKVIHKGYLPKEEETKKFIIAIGTFLVEHCNFLIHNFETQIRNEPVETEMKLKATINKPSSQSAVVLLPTYFSLNKLPDSFQKLFNLDTALLEVSGYWNNIFGGEA